MATIVLHSSPADVEAVDGEWRKRGEQLLPVHVEEDSQHISNKRVLQWNDVARELIQSRKKIQEKIETLDFEEARAKLIAAFHVDVSDILEAMY